MPLFFDLFRSFLLVWVGAVWASVSSIFQQMCTSRSPITWHLYLAWSEMCCQRILYVPFYLSESLFDTIYVLNLKTLSTFLILFPRFHLLDPFLLLLVVESWKYVDKVAVRPTMAAIPKRQGLWNFAILDQLWELVWADFQGFQPISTNNGFVVSFVLIECHFIFLLDRLPCVWFNSDCTIISSSVKKKVKQKKKIH